MKYDSVVIGSVSLDINIDCEGNTRRKLGGAVVQAAFAAGRCGFSACVLPSACATRSPRKTFSHSETETRRCITLRDWLTDILTRKYFPQSRRDSLRVGNA